MVPVALGISQIIADGHETAACRRRQKLKKHVARVMGNLSNAASNFEQMPFSVISVTQMKERGESASGLKSLHMQRKKIG